MDYLCQLGKGDMLVLDGINVKVMHTGYPYPDCRYGCIYDGDNIMQSLGLICYDNYSKEVRSIMGSQEQMLFVDFKKRLVSHMKASDAESAFDYDNYAVSNLSHQVERLCRVLGVCDKSITDNLIDWFKLNKYAIDGEMLNSKFGILIGVTSYGESISGKDSLIGFYKVIKGYYSSKVHGISLVTDINSVISEFADCDIMNDADAFIWFNTTNPANQYTCEFAMYNEDLNDLFLNQYRDCTYERRCSDSGHVELVSTISNTDKDFVDGVNIIYNKDCNRYVGTFFFISFNECMLVA